MRNIISIILVSLSIVAYTQNDSISAQLKRDREIFDCEVVTLNAIDHLADYLAKTDYDSFEKVLNEWINLCGLSECAQRLNILRSIIHLEESIEHIEFYFENGFHYKYKYRIQASQRPNYGYIYSDYKSNYDYVPLRHPIDSIVAHVALDLLKDSTLTPDEILICNFFSGDIPGFEDELKRKEYKDSYIRNKIRKETFNNHNSWLAYNVYSGVYSPIRQDKVFGYSPMIGLTFSSPMNYRFMVELGMKLRINIDDEDFDYYAMGDTNTVNSETSIFFGGLFGYQVYQSEKLSIIPKLGIGLESVSTGLSEEKNNSGEKDYHDVATIHLSAGITFLKPVFNRNYIGLGIHYHFCPYNADKDLHTDFNQSLVSTEISFRF